MYDNQDNTTHNTPTQQQRTVPEEVTSHPKNKHLKTHHHHHQVCT